jgi:tRNA(Ile)-lysidine synthase
LLKRVADFISRYNMFERGQSVGVAVSGGADSVCLLHALLELAPRWALKLSVLHLDHQLRGAESLEDAEFVRKIALGLGLPVHQRAVDVARLKAETGRNLEEIAREARRRFFLDCLRAGVVGRIALGHTRSDQAETVLFRLLRGCGTAGLAGILPATREGIVRPLLEIDRVEVERFLRGRNLTWREDSSNLNPDYDRNRIRRELLPSLVRDWNPSLPDTLARMAALARDEEEYWDREITALAKTHLVKDSVSVLLRAGDLRALARPVARRLVRRAIRDVKGDLRRIGFGHVDAVLQLAEEPEGHARVQLPDLDVLRSFDWIRLAAPGSYRDEARNFRLLVPVPGSVANPATGSTLTLSASSWDEKDYGLDGERIPPVIELRNWQPGDRYCPAGDASPEKVKTLFQRHKIPLWERRRWPILTAGDTILWARRFGPAAEYAAGPESRRVLKISETEEA